MRLGSQRIKRASVLQATGVQHDIEYLRKARFSLLCAYCARYTITIFIGPPRYHPSPEA